MSGRVISAPAHIRRLAGLLRPYRGRWWLATLALLLGGAVNLALPQAVRYAIDDAVTARDAAALDRIAWLALAGFAALAVLVFARAYLMSWLGSRVVADLRQRIFEHLLRHPPGFFHEKKSGELVSRLTSDVQMLQYAVGSELSIALRSSLTVLGGMALLIVTSPGLSLTMLALVPPLAVGAVWVGRRIRRRARQVQDLVAEAHSGLEEAVSAIETVQSFGAEPFEARRYGHRVLEAFRVGLQVAVARSGFMAGAQFAAYAAIGAILWLGANQVIADTLSPGDLASFLLYTLMVTGGLVSLAEIWGNLQSAIGATGRIFELLGEVPTIRDAADAAPLPAPRGHVAFQGVSFTYPSRPEVPVLTDVSFEARPGEVVALVGPSGAGKSTIAALVHRFHDPDSGRVLVDGHDLRALRLVDLRRAIGTVHQEPMLFSGTIAENIAYGLDAASPDAIAQAARDACIADFVASLPDGYDTLVGERGVKLSGGQRQRIAIARALLADPRVLILDEATSHLDTENEAQVQQALSRLMQGRTTLVIAHRLSTVQRADRILVLDRGRIVEAGSHADLLETGPLYRRLTAAQALVA